jgi:hypothetical protein
MPAPIPLIIGPAEQAKLDELTARAAASPIDYATMQAIAQADKDPKNAPRLRAQNRALSVEIPTAFTVTLTHEEHKPGVMCRHLSVGVRTTPGRGPSPAAVMMIMQALGFVNRLGRLPVYLETLDDGTAAINLVEPLDGDCRKLEKPRAPHVD